MSKPKIMVYKSAKERIISIRKILELDCISTKEYTLIQWGRNPVKFLIYLKQDKPPTFLFSVRWTTKHIFWKLRCGHTTKPVNLTKFWSTTCTPVTDLDPFRHMNMKTKRISSTSTQTTTIAE